MYSCQNKTKKAFLSCFQRSSRNSILLPSLSLRKLPEERFFTSQTPSTSRHNHVLIRVSWGLEPKVCVNRRAKLVHRTRNIQGGYFLNRLHAVSKSAPRTCIKTLHFLWNPIKIRRARAPVPSRHTTYMYPGDKLTADLLCSICQVQNSRFTRFPTPSRIHQTTYGNRRVGHIASL